MSGNVKKAGQEVESARRRAQSAAGVLAGIPAFMEQVYTFRRIVECCDRALAELTDDPPVLPVGVLPEPGQNG